MPDPIPIISLGIAILCALGVIGVFAWAFAEEWKIAKALLSATLFASLCASLGAVTIRVAGSGLDSVRAASVDSVRCGRTVPGEGWTVSPIERPAAVKGSGSAVLSNCLYQIGGGDTTNVFRFDGSTWTEVAGLPFSAEMIQGNVAVCGGYIYVAKGQGATNFARFDGIAWEQLEPMPVAGSSGYSVLGSVTGAVYAFEDGMSNTYQYITNWVLGPYLPNNWGVGDHAVDYGTMASVGADLYFKSGRAAAFFRFRDNVWELVDTPFGDNQNNSKIIAHDGAVYLAGGGNRENNAQTNVFVFDGTTWTEIVGLPEKRIYPTGESFQGKIHYWGNYSAELRTNTFLYEGEHW